ncbi:MAG: hypothetical protein WCI04_07100 [archaeon]
MANETSKVESVVKETESPKHVETKTVETKTVEAKTVETKSGSNKTVIIVVVVLLVCCCISLVIGGVFWAYSSRLVGTLNDISTSTFPMNPDGTDTSTKVTSTPNPNEAPSLASVKAEYFSTVSYHFTGDSTGDDGTEVIYSGEFEAPANDHYITTSKDGSVTEEIVVEGAYYIKEDTAAWKKVTENDVLNAGLQRSNMEYMFKTIDMTIEGKSADENFWVYEYNNTAKKELWMLYVSKSGGLPGKVYAEFEENGIKIKDNLVLSKYDDPAISIVAPL